MKILFRRALLGAVLAFAALTLFGAPANAADGAAHAVIATVAVAAFTLDPSLVIQLVVSTVLPLLVGLVTKTVTRPGLKAVLLALFSLVTSLLVELGAAITADTTYDVGRGLLLALPTFLIAVGLHYGLWKPVGAAVKAQELFDSNTVAVRESVVAAVRSDSTLVDSAQDAVGSAGIMSLAGYTVREGQQLPRPKFGHTILFHNGLRIDSDGVAHLPESSPDGVDGNGLTYLSVGRAR